MEITLTTPALLFPAVSLLMLAYTNRFLGLAALIRNLHERYTQTREDVLKGEIANLHQRVILIRNMQVAGALSILFSAIAMFAIHAGKMTLANCIFVLSLLSFILSLALSVWEIWISVRALNLHLSSIASKQTDN